MIWDRDKREKLTEVCFNFNFQNLEHVHHVCFNRARRDFEDEPTSKPFGNWAKFCPHPKVSKIFACRSCSSLSKNCWFLGTTQHCKIQLQFINCQKTSVGLPKFWNFKNLDKWSCALDVQDDIPKLKRMSKTSRSYAYVCWHFTFYELGRVHRLLYFYGELLLFLLQKQFVKILFVKILFVCHSLSKF